MSGILVIGAAVWDVIGNAARPVGVGDDVPGRIVRRTGGVAANVARALALAGVPVTLASVVGSDAEAEALLGSLARAGVDCSRVQRSDLRTGFYVAVEDGGGLVAAVADVAALVQAGDAVLDGMEGFATVVLDGNLAPAVLAAARVRARPEATLWLVPASTAKSVGIDPSGFALAVNRHEAEAVCARAFTGCAEAAEALVSRGARRALVTFGAHPAAEARPGLPTIEARPPAVDPAFVTGAGDAAFAALLAADLAGATRDEALAAALRAGSAHVAAAASD